MRCLGAELEDALAISEDVDPESPARVRLPLVRGTASGRPAGRSGPPLRSPRSVASFIAMPPSSAPPIPSAVRVRGGKTAPDRRDRTATGPTGAWTTWQGAASATDRANAFTAASPAGSMEPRHDGEVDERALGIEEARQEPAPEREGSGVWRRQATGWSERLAQHAARDPEEGGDADPAHRLEERRRGGEGSRQAQGREVRRGEVAQRGHEGRSGEGEPDAPLGHGARVLGWAIGIAEVRMGAPRPATRRSGGG